MTLTRSAVEYRNGRAGKHQGEFPPEFFQVNILGLLFFDFFANLQLPAKSLIHIVPYFCGKETKPLSPDYSTDAQSFIQTLFVASTFPIVPCLRLSSNPESFVLFCSSVLCH